MQTKAGKRLRGIRGKDAIKVFLKAGGVLKGGKGDHVNIKMPNGLINYNPSKWRIKN